MIRHGLASIRAWAAASCYVNPIPHQCRLKAIAGTINGVVDKLKK